MSVLQTAPSIYKDHPALTYFQPWATLVAMGAKQCETTRLPADPRLVNRRVLIRASSNTSSVQIIGRTRTCMSEALASMSLSLDALPSGAIVGTAFVRGCYRIKDRAADTVELDERVPGSDPQLMRVSLSYPERVFTVLQPGRWLWHFSDAAVFLPTWEVGTIKVTTGRKGGGVFIFIVRDDGPDVFLHRSLVPAGACLNTGDVVSFRASRGANGYKAFELRLGDTVLASLQDAAA